MRIEKCAAAAGPHHSKLDAVMWALQREYSRPGDVGMVTMAGLLMQTIALRYKSQVIPPEAIL